jgi:Lar family restriction alleviation protein
MSEELKPCPFCGGKASDRGKMKYHKSHDAFFADGTRILKSYFVNCIVCGVSNKGLVGHQTREKAVDKWNTRTT